MERIRLVHKALDQEMTGTPKLIHALQVKTFDAAQWIEKE
jgi:stress-induced morphogen